MICVTVWLKDVPGPIYHDCDDQKCVDGQKVLKKFIPHFSCPIPEGCMYIYLQIGSFVDFLLIFAPIADRRHSARANLTVSASDV